MSNYFPAGRLYQKLMIALDGSATIKLIVPSFTSTIGLKQGLIADYIGTPANYPQYATIESFKEMLNTINLVHINGGTYSLDGTNSVSAPVATDGGIFIPSAQNFATLIITGSDLVLYSKPTP